MKEYYANILPPPSTVEKLHRQFVDHVNLKNSSDPSHPALVTVIYRSRILSDVKRDLRLVEGDRDIKSHLIISLKLREPQETDGTHHTVGHH